MNFILIYHVKLCRLHKLKLNAHHPVFRLNFVILVLNFDVELLLVNVELRNCTSFVPQIFLTVLSSKIMVGK
jgi:hypothetical protein